MPKPPSATTPSPTLFALALLSLLAVLTLAPATPAAAATLPTGFTETQIVSGLASPTAMAFAPDGRIFVALQGGQLRVIKNGALLPTPFLTVTVSSSGERGLLGVTFDPDFATNRFVYVYYTATTPAIHNRLSRFTANGDVAVAGSETVLLELNNLTSATNHNGGALHFGPDGKLYVAVGENATSSNSQTLGNLLGKILRLNKDGTIPTDNPFFGSAGGNNRAIWALGLRNPFTFAFQPGSGRMFINDVGQNAWEEINDGIAGSNYGWPNTEGPTTNPAYRAPLFSYGHGSGATTGCAITGGVFYNPTSPQFPADYVGKYFFADYCSGWIRRFDPATGTSTAFASGISSPVDLRLTDDGSLWYLARGNGAVYRVNYTASQAPNVTADPQSRTVAVSQSATFTVAASGTAPLSYQWQRNGADIAGATGSSYTLASATLADNGAAFRAIVSNAFGSDTSNAATLTVTSNQAPTAAITAPANNTLYRGGETFTYSGTGSDPEDGNLPPSAFTWQIDFHHASHTHPFLAPTSGATGGTFTIPTSGETADDVFYRLYLTVRDSAGLTHTVFHDVVPRKATITLQTVPAGLQLTLDGQPVTAPHSVVGVVGITRTLGVVSPQTVGGTSYTFQSWSDGGAATHTISTPAANTTYTATFQAGGLSIGNGLGLTGTYFDNANLTGATVVRVDPTVNYDWGTGGPASGIAADTFSVRWNGQVHPKASGLHTFFTSSDDGVRLWVNNQLIIDNWTDHAPTENSGTISLTAGQKVDIRMEMYENAGGAVAKLLWQAPGVAKEVVPRSQLYPYALLVTSAATLNAGDTAVRNRLLSLGFAPVQRTATAAVAADAANKALVLVSSTVGSANVNTKFRTVVNPVLHWENSLYDDFGMTGTAAGSFGALGSQTQLNVINTSHPIGAGLTTGLQPITTAARAFTWGVPGAGATVIARVNGSTTRAAVFAYDKGAAMPGLTAPGRRVGFFLGDTGAEVLTAQGARLFDNAVRWAAGL
jgi:glucose/arabinose dehydrogenase